MPTQPSAQPLKQTAPALRPESCHSNLTRHASVCAQQPGQVPGAVGRPSLPGWLASCSGSGI